MYDFFNVKIHIIKLKFGEANIYYTFLEYVYGIF